MVSIVPDVGRNVLVLEVSGKPGAAEISAVEQQLHDAIRRLRPPFDVISDVRNLESLEDLAAAEFVRLAKVLMTARVRRVVRVVGRSKTAAVQLERLSRLVNHSAHLAFSREEADELLNQR